MSVLPLDAITPTKLNSPRWWYKPVLPHEKEFPLSCRTVLINFVCALSSHIVRKRPGDMFLQFATNSSSLVIVFLNELSSALGPPAANPAPVADSISDYLKDYPDSSLADILSTDQQQKKLRLVAADLLKSYLDVQAYKCEPVRVFFREVLSGLILEMTVDSCSKPEYINSWIVYLLEEGEPELLNAIEAGLERANEGDMKMGSHQKSSSKSSKMGDRKSIEEPNRGDLAAAVSDHRKLNIENPPNSGDVSDLGSIGRTASEPAIVPENGMAQREDLLLRSKTADELNPLETVAGNTTEYASNRDGSHSKTSADALGTGNALNPQKDNGNIVVMREAPEAVKACGSTVTIVEDFNPSDKSGIRIKPVDDYLIQIEPASSKHTGWMIARKYTDFEYLHETLRRISRIAGVQAFTEQHDELPGWKGRDKNDLQRALEQYLQHALQHEHLAESEGMRKFLEKGRESGYSHEFLTPKGNFPFATPPAFENMGKNMLGALSTAPKGIASGGKAIVGGMSGIFGPGGNGNKRWSHNGTESPRSFNDRPRMSQFSRPNSFDQNSGRPSNASSQERPEEGFQYSGVRATSPGANSLSSSKSVVESPAGRYDSWEDVADWPQNEKAPVYQPADDTKPIPEAEIEAILQSKRTGGHPTKDTNIENHDDNGNDDDNSKQDPRRTLWPALSEDETSMVVELLFAVINEIYGLSAAWNIRKKFLNAAKSYLLRPGNPSLEAIRTLLQDSVLDANTSDEAIAGYLNQIHETSIPPYEEGAESSPPPTQRVLSDEEKEKLRIKARNLLVTRGMPPALMGLMGGNATAESLGRIFDCLQIESVARGFVFAQLIQALKIIVQ